MTSRVRIYQEIEKERLRQIDKGYSHKSDDGKNAVHWHEDIDVYFGWAVQNWARGDIRCAIDDLTKTAALAVAALEALYREVDEEDEATWGKSSIMDLPEKVED